MSRESSSLWISLLKWGVLLPVAITAAYFCSYWWLWHTTSGNALHSWLYLGEGKPAPPRLVRSAYERLYTPARESERAWRIAMFGRKLNGLWVSDDGAVQLRFEGAHMVAVSGFDDPSIPDGTKFSARGLCGPSLFLRTGVASSSPYVTVPPESIGGDTCVVRVSSTRQRGFRSLALHRAAASSDTR